MTITLLTPNEYHASTCGYCSPSGRRSVGKSSYSYGMFAQQMSCAFYQDIIDRGWRRSGTYTYHPDMGRTCCPQYTIRLDASQFKPTRHQRSAVNRWNRFLSTGMKPGDKEDDSMTGNAGKGGGKGKGKVKPFDLVSELRAHQAGYGDGKHTFRLELTKANATAETFALYKRYQMSVHNDPEHKATRKGFEGFLCRSPLLGAKISYNADADTTGLPTHYSSYHLLYRVDEKLIGISVIDILPSCVSSVYFIWDPDWAWASLGKLSALYEIALVRDMKAAGAPGMAWLYMGYWIATCVKMRYKGEYSPSYLLDPGTNKWHPLTPKMDKYLAAKRRGYTPFVDIEVLSEADLKVIIEAAPESEKMTVDESEVSDEDSDGDDDSDFPSPPPPGFLDPTTLDDKALNALLVLNIGEAGSTQLIPYQIFRSLVTPWARIAVTELVAALGSDMFATKERGDFDTRGLLYFS